MILSQYLNKEEFSSIGTALKEIANSVKSNARVTGKTHLHYKYPAGFSPEFPNSVIRAFSRPGELILDPFMGGGTTLIEAINLQRKSIGIDVNEIAVFSSKLKSVNLSTSAISELEEWLLDIIETDKRTFCNVPLEYLQYFNGLPKTFANAVYFVSKSIETLRLENSKIFAKGVLLRSAQILLDSRKFDPSVSDLFNRMQTYFDIMLEQTMNFSSEIKRNKSFKPEIFYGDCRDINTVNSALEGKQKISAIVTSPPYPGVHVLYNRWQYRGRKEISLPYFIIGSNQKLSPAFFTLGNRHSPNGLEQYFSSIKEIYSNIGQFIEKGTPVIQLVAFNNKHKQLDAFLHAMKEAGYIENKAYSASDSKDGRLWREVPHRRWYNSLGNSSHSSQEVALIHRKK